MSKLSFINSIACNLLRPLVCFFDSHAVKVSDDAAYFNLRTLAKLTAFMKRALPCVLLGLVQGCSR